MPCKITLIACNRLKNGAENELINSYTKRLTGSVDIIEIESKKRDEAEQCRDENSQILVHLNNINGYIVCMDETGKSFKSREFATHIENKILPLHSHIIFIIGGASGLSDELKDKANLLLCMGRMTWPHKLARVMLFEQIYRAFSILNGHPYHKD